MVAKAVVLLSGGLDSATCLAWVVDRGYQPHALSFRYGQRHDAELDAACELARIWRADHRVIDLDPRAFQGSSLTGTGLVADHGQEEGIPSTYVPARNTIFLSYALGWAEVIEAEIIVAGMSHVDYSGYPDCRPEYMKAFQALINLATKATVSGRHVELITPLMELSKAETVALGLKLGVDYAPTVSCYRADAQGRACGRCDSCALRREGFEKAGVVDPTRYQF